MRINIEITEYDEKNVQTLGLNLEIYNKDARRAKDMAKALIEAVNPESK